MNFDYFTEAQLANDPGFQADLDKIYDGITPGTKNLDQFTCREIVVSRLDGDTERLREIERRNIHLVEGELDTNYHEVAP